MSTYKKLLQDEVNDFTGVLTGSTREELDKMINLLNEVRTVETLPFQYAEAGDSVYRLTDYSAENKSFSSISLMTGKTPTLYVKDKYESVKDKLSEEEFDALMREALNTSLLFRFNGEAYFIGYDALDSLADRIGMQEKGIRKNKLERDVWIASELRDNVRTAYQVAYTEIGNVKKVFGVHSMDYRRIGDENITEIIDGLTKELGECSLRFYVTQNITNVIAYFPEKGKEIAATYGMKGFIPAIRIMNSQTGQSALRVEALWTRSVGSTTFYVLSRKEQCHKGFREGKIEKFIESIKDNVFDVYTRVPERMCDLMGIMLYDGTGDGEEVFKDVLDIIFDKLSLESWTLLGSKMSKKVKEAYQTAIDTTVPFSAFDVVNTLIDLPDRTGGVSKAKLELLRKALSKLIYFPFEDIVEELDAEVYVSA